LHWSLGGRNYRIISICYLSICFSSVGLACIALLQGYECGTVGEKDECAMGGRNDSYGDDDMKQIKIAERDVLERARAK
jgi:hypothetical protein